MNRNKVEDLLDRYLKKKTTIEENKLIEQWLEENGNPDSEWQQMNRSEKDKWLFNVLVDIEKTTKVKPAKQVIMQPQRQLWYKVASVADISGR